MREIKFRAWFDGHMYEVAKLDFWGDPEQATCDMAGPGKSGEWEELFDIYVGEVELIQYTGLKDENGKEIYEGDIVRADDLWGRRKTLEIFWHAFLGTWGTKCYDIDDSVSELLEQEYVCSGLATYQNFEVIGNIYENPELMEDG